MDKSSRPKDKGKILNRIKIVTQRMERSGNFAENAQVMADALNEVLISAEETK